MNAHGDETPDGMGGPSDIERDVLAERRARRGVEASGDPILVRRAETAEAAAQALEERLTRIQARLNDAEHECSRASERLGEREQELHLASERLLSGEQELHAVTGRLAGRETELRIVSDRLGEREQQLHAVSERLIVREQELRKAELEIKSRLEGLEGRVQEVQSELAAERKARESAERELAQVRAALGRTETLVGELRAAAGRLRSALEAAAASGDPLASEQERERRAEMSEALASAVERLRARVAAVGELHEQRIADDGDQMPARPQWTPYVPRTAVQGSDRSPWLAQAIRGVAERRDARLAAELVMELLPAQAPSVKGRIRYRAQIAELGDYEVTVGDGGASIVRSADRAASDQPDFILSGPAAAFAEIAAGGAPKRPAGLRVRGRLRARRLVAARREPVSLSDLAAAGVVVWPGLLLLAMVEAIDPSWAGSQRFAIAFEIVGPQSATLHLQVRDGQPLQLVRAPSLTEDPGAIAAGDAPAAADELEVAVTARLSERAFGCMLAGVALPEGEQVLISGDAAALESALRWMDEVQGIRRLGE